MSVTKLFRSLSYWKLSNIDLQSQFCNCKYSYKCNFWLLRSIIVLRVYWSLFTTVNVFINNCCLIRLDVIPRNNVLIFRKRFGVVLPLETPVLGPWFDKLFWHFSKNWGGGCQLCQITEHNNEVLTKHCCLSSLFCQYYSKLNIATWITEIHY